MSQQIQESLSVLDHITRRKNTRENRSTKLLRDPNAETPDGWFMYVPICFNDALDIKQTERVDGKKKNLMWSQGSTFSFKAGDTLYDTSDAYKVWSAALKSINICVQIKTAYDAGQYEKGSDRFSGSVTISILSPNEDRSKLIDRGEYTMSQDEFVRFLIVGPSVELMTRIGNLLTRY